MELFNRNILVSVHSDDPAYFGGYIVENYVQVALALELSRETLVKLARNSIESAFMSDEEKAPLFEELDQIQKTIEDSK